jgi:hypothetical protein
MANHRFTQVLLGKAEETTPASRHTVREWLEQLEPAQAEFSDEVVDGLEAMRQLTGREAEWWLNRLLFVALKGRLQLEEIEPLRYEFCVAEATSPCRKSNTLRVSTHLTDLVASCAQSADLAEDEFLLMTVRRSIFGVSSSDSLEVPSGFDGPDEASLKIWLPVAVHTAVSQLANHWSLSVSDVLRNLLLEHLIGRLGLLQLVIASRWKLRRRMAACDDDGLIMFSRRQRTDETFKRRSYGIAAFGKSTINIKLWCPLALRDGLTYAADSRGFRLSDYVRLVITGYVFGQPVTAPMMSNR